MADGDRRHVTVLFCDLSQSTRLTEQIEVSEALLDCPHTSA
ncbi:MAG: hypothetical protein AAGE01_07195 [Pseudomonadota bacterium]